MMPFSVTLFFVFLCSRGAVASEALMKLIVCLVQRPRTVCDGLDVVLTFFFRSKELSTMETETEVKADAPAATETPVVAATEDKEEEPVEKVRAAGCAVAWASLTGGACARDSSWTTPSSRR
jgi:hypothetical protein